MCRNDIVGELMFKFVSHNENETKKIANILASKLEIPHGFLRRGLVM